MGRHLWHKFFLLLIAVVMISLSSAFLLRELMISDFRKFLEGEREDRVYWITAALESSYETHGGWDRDQLIRDIAWAYVLGLDISLADASGRLVLNTREAIMSLSPLVQKRFLALSKQPPVSGQRTYVPYDLFLRGSTIGKIEVSFLQPGKESFYIARSNRLLLMSLLILGGCAIIVSIMFARGLTQPLQTLTDAATAVAEGDLKKRVEINRKDEIGILSDTFNIMTSRLELLHQLRKKLTANIAHELRTPVSAIQGELEGMSDGLIPLNRDSILSLQEEISRLSRLLDGITELSQAEASGLTLQPSRFLLKPFLLNIRERLRKLFIEKDITFSIDCDEVLMVYADPDRLSQIMINLLSNAARACHVKGMVSVHADTDGSTVRIAVRDNGAGIMDNDLPFIFERFYHSSEGGLGIGLAIVKELVEAHGGTVAAQSSEGTGSVFTVTLPSEHLHILS